MSEIRFITLNPGHFHAALVQKEMYPGVAPLVHVYAPVGPDLLLHLQRITAFNQRRVQPTHWELEVHANPRYLDQLRQQKPGNVVIIAGRNRDKIAAIHAALDADLHVLADKPWIILEEDMPKLKDALEIAERKKLIAFDIMTERHDITAVVLRALLQDPAIFGTIVPGSPDEPGVFMESVHYLKKTVAGVPLRRPASFFDIHQHGEGLSDVGTHLVDLVPYLLYPDQVLPLADVSILAAQRRPTTLTRDEYQQVTGEQDFDPALHEYLQQGQLAYYCNTLVNYSIRGVHVKLDIRWDFEAARGSSERLVAVFRGTRARAEVRQGREENAFPEVQIVPNSAMDYAWLQTALERRVQALAEHAPGLGLIDMGTHYRIAIPTRLRDGHEAHFARVTQQFLKYVRGDEPFPAWERSNMLLKYQVTTRGVALSQRPNR